MKIRAELNRASNNIEFVVEAESESDRVVLDIVGTEMRQRDGGWLHFVPQGFVMDNCTTIGMRLAVAPIPCAPQRE